MTEEKKKASSAAEDEIDLIAKAPLTPKGAILHLN